MGRREFASLISNMVKTIFHKPSWPGLTRVVALIMMIPNYELSDAYASKFTPVWKRQSRNVCLTEICNATSSRISNNMDQKVAPCDNFYKFACGGFLKATVIPSDQNVINAYTEIEDRVCEQLKTVLDEESSPMEIRPFKLAKNLYKACLNEYAIEQQGVSPLKEVITKLGGWPVLEGDQWNETNFGWMKTADKFMQNGYFPSYFLGFKIDKNFRNSTKWAIILDDPSFSLSKMQLIDDFEDPIIKAYYKSMVKIAVILGADEQQAELDLLKSIKFEIALAKVSLPYEERRNMSSFNNVMSIASLLQKWPSIPWMDYLEMMLSSNIVINEDEPVIVPNPNFITHLEKLMQTTPKRVQMNYAVGMAIRESLSFLNREIKQSWFSVDSTLTDVTTKQPRWKDCVTTVENHLSNILSALYVRKYFKKDDKDDIIEIARAIQNQFRKTLQTIDWMDNATKTSALEKITAMKALIAYSDKLLDDEELIEAYKDLELTGYNYLHSKLNITLFIRKNMIEHFRKPYHNSWISPTNANTAYWPKGNVINVLAAILQGMFFNKNRPRYLNYGAIGFLIGHEVTHGFDNEGRQYDKNGNVINWWTPRVEKRFLEKTACVIDQYNQYIIEELGLNLNGVNTLDENIADIGGFKMAYNAYIDWTASRNNPEPMLPRLSYTPRQLFWISAANTQCSALRREYVENHIIKGVWSPPEFRIIGSFSNLPEFSKDFECEKGSKMNPLHKCTVW